MDEVYGISITDKGRAVLEEIYTMYSEGKTVEEIAQTMDLPLDTMRLFVAIDNKINENEQS